MELTGEQLRKLALLRPDINVVLPTSTYKIEGFMQGVKQLIELCGDEPYRDGLEETPFRVLKAFLEYTKGYGEDPAQHLGKSFDVHFDELILIKDIPFNSLCEHHFAPFFGVAHIAYIPQGNAITGLSKFARMTDGYAQRFQVQERLTAQLADAVERVLNPLGTAVIIEAEHYCMCGRGVKKTGAKTVTSAMRGAFREKDAARAELMQLIKG